MKQQIHIARWRVFEGTIQNEETGENHACKVVIPVARRDSIECVLCAHGVCQQRIKPPRDAGACFVVSHSRGASA